jgi:hypothetical protein
MEISRFFRVPLEQIGYVRAIVEAYEGLAYLRSNDARRGEVELLIPTPGTEVENLIERLGRETGWVEIPRPADWGD